MLEGTETPPQLRWREQVDQTNPVNRILMQMFGMGAAEVVDDKEALQSKKIIRAVEKAGMVFAPNFVYGDKGGAANPKNWGISLGEAGATTGFVLALNAVSLAAFPVALALPLGYAISRGIVLLARSEAVGGRIRRLVERFIPRSKKIEQMARDVANKSAEAKLLTERKARLEAEKKALQAELTALNKQEEVTKIVSDNQKLVRMEQRYANDTRMHADIVKKGEDIKKELTPYEGKDGLLAKAKDKLTLAERAFKAKNKSGTDATELQGLQTALTVAQTEFETTQKKMDELLQRQKAVKERFKRSEEDLKKLEGEIKALTDDLDSREMGRIIDLMKEDDKWSGFLDAQIKKIKDADKGGNPELVNRLQAELADKVKELNRLEKEMEIARNDALKDLKIKLATAETNHKPFVKEQSAKGVLKAQAAAELDRLTGLVEQIKADPARSGQLADAERDKASAQTRYASADQVDQDAIKAAALTGRILLAAEQALRDAETKPGDIKLDKPARELGDRIRLIKGKLLPEAQKGTGKAGMTDKQVAKQAGDNLMAEIKKQVREERLKNYPR